MEAASTDKEPGRTKLLFVDDEMGIRMTLPLILERHGFAVTVAATVKEALQEISSQAFDVLLTDLNIGQPGDGFTVVSAMRRTQPDVATVILTGYPAFETALTAIRNQVDDYVVKPAHPEQLVQTLRSKLDGRNPQHRIITKRVSYVIQEHKEEIIENWVKAVREDQELNALKLDRAKLVDHVPKILDEIVRLSKAEEKTVLAEVTDAAAQHGKLRRKQGYSVYLMVRETALLRTEIQHCVQTNLLAVEISFLIQDMMVVSQTVDQMLEIAVANF